MTNPELRPLTENLIADPRPSTVLSWLYGPQAIDLLRALSTGTIALTHDALHAWPHVQAAQHLRHRLIACGLLPAADRHLLEFESWLHRRFATLAEHPHEQLLRRFALWHQLPRLRADAAVRPLRATAMQYVTGQFTQAVVLLTWLHEHHIEPHQLTQAALDQWFLDHRIHQRHNVRGFLLWATAHGHLPRHLRIPRVAFKPGLAITQQRRIELLRHYIHDDTGSLVVRAAACLLLLYAQPLSRIQRLTRTDLTDIDGQLHLDLGKPASPVPPPIGALLHRLIDDNERRGQGDQWLFPGRLTGQHIAYRTLHGALREHGFPLKEARVAALRELVQQAPAPVIADALGYHHTTTTRQSNHAGATWNRYPTNPTR
jgi:hypothetical protein